MEDKKIGLRIRALRKNRKLSQVDMAEAINISQSAYAKIENGKTCINLNRLDSISRFLDVPISSILSSGYNDSNRTKQPSQSGELILHMKSEIRFLREQVNRLSQN